jgi:hypothetical protein
MKYLLAVGFFCSVYEKKPQARLFLNNNLIDEFDIDPCLEKKSLLPEGVLTPFKWEIRKKQSFNRLPNLRIYEIELNSISENSILRIEIKNNNNNYSNGFMSKNTLIRLSALYLIPYNKKLIKKLISRQRANQYNENYAWQYIRKNHLFDLVPYSIWYGKNKQRFGNEFDLIFCEIGGDGFFECKLRKKYNIFITNLKKPYRVVINIAEVEYIMNKYQQDENQRNTD